MGGYIRTQRHQRQNNLPNINVGAGFPVKTGRKRGVGVGGVDEGRCRRRVPIAHGHVCDFIAIRHLRDFREITPSEIRCSCCGCRAMPPSAQVYMGDFTRRDLLPTSIRLLSASWYSPMCIFATALLFSNIGDACHHTRKPRAPLYLGKTQKNVLRQTPNLTFRIFRSPRRCYSARGKTPVDTRGNRERCQIWAKIRKYFVCVMALCDKRLILIFVRHGAFL